jgi:hypothetical protein
MSTLRSERIHRERVSLFWPIVLIGAGIILLMDMQGMLVNQPLLLLANYWPVIFIVAGVELIFSKSGNVAKVVSALLGVLVVAGAIWLLTSPDVVLTLPVYYSVR